MTDDIVSTLRQNKFYLSTSGLNSGNGMPQMVFDMTVLNLIAAEEIERLRARVAKLENMPEDSK